MSQSRGAVILLVILPAILMACGPRIDADDAGGDAGDAADAGSPIAPPDIPWLEDGMPPIALPILTPCPEGWHEVVQAAPEDPEGEMDVVACDPYGTDPEGTEPDTCPEGEVHFPGAPGCAPVGAPCPSGDFPEGLPSDSAVLYVLAGVPLGGDGSAASPLSTITEGLALASPGSIVAVGKGEYDEALRIPPGVTLWGACAAQTRLTASSPGPLNQGVITVPFSDTRVTNLWVGPAELPGIVAFGDRASLSLDGVVIDGARTVGLGVSGGGRVDGHELVVSGTRADDVGRFGRGVVVNSSTLDLRRAWISENRDIGVSAANEGASLTLSDVAIRATRARLSDSGGGRGLTVASGAAATVTRTSMSRNRELGAFAEGDGTSLTLTDVVIRDTEAQERDGASGRGLNVQNRATATVSRTRFVGNRQAGVYAGDEDTTLTLSDVVIRDTRAQESDGMAGRGLSMEAGARVMLTRALLTRNRDMGVFSDGDGTSLTVSDVVIRDTLAQESDGTAGGALSVELGATATVTRGLLERNREAGVFVGGANASLTLSDVVVRDTQAQESDGWLGRGLSVQAGATAIVARALLERNREVGAAAIGDSASLVLSDVVIRDTQPRQSDGTQGRGLNVQGGAAVTVTRAQFARNREVAVLAISLGTVELLDVVVTQTDARTCADTTCREEPFGVGLLGADDASLSATRFAVQDGALCGVMVADDGEVDLAIGEVSGFQIGVCLQVDRYSVPRLTDRVRYADNGTNLDTTSLPVPEVVNPLAGTR